MPQTAIRDQILEDLEKLSPDLQEQVGELVHTMATSGSKAIARDDVLRFAIDHPLDSLQVATAIESSDLKGQPEEGPLLAPDAQPDAALGQIRSLLADGRVLTARRLAAKAAARFPDHAETGNARRILNASGAAVVAGGPEPSTDDEFEWLRNPPEWARGKWVALLGEEAIASAETLVELDEALKSMNLSRQPLVHRID